ncbi:hypothetical protein ACVWZK_008499 [Bradyrhizobium sp. GM0.4]
MQQRSLLFSGGRQTVRNIAYLIKSRRYSDAANISRVLNWSNGAGQSRRDLILSSGQLMAG